MAISWHPDKNDTENAADNFRMLAQVTETLKNSGSVWNRSARNAKFLLFRFLFIKQRHNLLGSSNILRNS